MTTSAVASLIGTAIGQPVRCSTHIRICFCPALVSESGPKKSIKKTSNRFVVGLVMSVWSGGTFAML